MHPFDISTIIFAILAIFVVWKLRSVLGTRTGHEKEPPTPFNARRSSTGQNDAAGNRNGSNGDNVVPLPGAAPRPQGASAAWGGNAPDRWGTYAENGSKAAAGLDAIAATDPSFSIGNFMAGAKTAYEMIITAFAADDRPTLQRLLSQDVFQSFLAAIEGRENRSETMKTTLVSIDSVTVDDAAMRDRTAQITLRFAVKLISATENSAGSVIEGSLDRVVDTIDVWTFARDSQSRDPNWKLIATQSGH
jgi:predicted lipid-binding transport protein (Tim44 family)